MLDQIQLHRQNLLMTQIKQLPARSEVNPADTWDLSSLFPSMMLGKRPSPFGTAVLPNTPPSKESWAESAESLAACLQFDLDLDRTAERAGQLRLPENRRGRRRERYQRMQGRYMNVGSRAAQAASFIRPEILAIPAATMEAFLASPAIAPYMLILQRVLRYKPHTLGPRKKTCWPCRRKWPRRRTRSSASSTMPT